MHGGGSAGEQKSQNQIFIPSMPSTLDANLTVDTEISEQSSVAPNPLGRSWVADNGNVTAGTLDLRNHSPVDNH
jgi:hypothetical protein